MRKEMIIRMQTNSEKGHSKAIKVAAGIDGVESVTIAGEEKNLLLVIGIVDSNYITKKLRQKVGHAEVVELRTVDVLAEEWAARELGEHPYRYHPSPSPYRQTGARDHGYPMATNYLQMGARDHGYYTGTHYYPANSYSQMAQHQHEYYPSNTHTVVHHEYPSDPNNCSIM